jgi:hypothetical protein
MQRPKQKSSCAILYVVVAQGLFSLNGFAQATGRGELRLPDRSVSVNTSTFSASQAPGLGKAVVDVKVDSVRARSIAIARSDFMLSARGDMFGVRRWNAGRSRIQDRPRALGQTSIDLRCAERRPGGGSAVLRARRRGCLKRRSTQPPARLQRLCRLGGVDAADHQDVLRAPQPT